MAYSNSTVFGSTFVPGKSGDNRPIIVWDDFITAYSVLQAEPALTQDPSAKFCDLADRGEWLMSIGGNPSVYPSMADESGGVATMTTGGSSGNRITCQLNGEMFSLADGKELYFEIRANFSTSADFYTGVVLADVNLSGVTNGVVMGIAGSSTFLTRVEKNSVGSPTETATLLEDDAYSVLAFRCRADKKIDFYVNGAKAALFDSAASFPDDELLSPVFQIESNGVAETLKVDYILCVGER